MGTVAGELERLVRLLHSLVRIAQQPERRRQKDAVQDSWVKPVQVCKRPMRDRVVDR